MSDLTRTMLIVPCRSPHVRAKLVDYLMFIERHFWATEDLGTFDDSVYTEAKKRKRSLEEALEGKRRRAAEHNRARDDLARMLQGQTEVSTASGLRCDVLTDEYAIEVKQAAKWPHAMGQAIAYAHAFNRKPAVFFYDKPAGKQALETCASMKVTVL